MKRVELKKLIKEVIIREGMVGMSRRDLEKLDKIKKSSTNRKDFLKKAMKVGLGVAALAMLYQMGKSDTQSSDTSVPSTQQTKHYIQLPSSIESQLDDRTAMNINSILRETGFTNPNDVLLTIKFVRYKQARPFASRWNMGQWATDIENAAKYLGIRSETVQALDIAWDRSGCK